MVSEHVRLFYSWKECSVPAVCESGHSLVGTWVSFVPCSCSTDVVSTLHCLNMWVVPRRRHSLLLVFTLLGSQCLLYICSFIHTHIHTHTLMETLPSSGKCVRGFHGHILLLLHKPWPTHSHFKPVLCVRVSGLIMFCWIILHGHKTIFN